jgi:hypothetical protein
MASFLLVHAPLLGPGSWRRCAEVLRAAGHDVLVPDLRAHTSAAAGWFARVADACGQAARERAEVVVVGHSGAGVVLPLIASRCATAAVVFVDAIPPAESGETVPSARIRSFVAALPHDGGRLPPWSTWWGEQALADLLPDVELRAALAADEPRLPTDFYDYAVPVPTGWPPPTVAYVQLSPAYHDDAAEAQRRGWTVRRVAGAHLDLLARPDLVAEAVLTSVGL